MIRPTRLGWLTPVTLGAIALLLAVRAPAVTASAVHVPGDFPTVQAAVDSIGRMPVQTIDTVIVSSPTQPGSLTIQAVDITFIGVPNASGTLPQFPQTTIVEGTFRFEKLRFTGPVTSWSSSTFLGCEIDTGLTTFNNSDWFSLDFFDCTLRGNPALAASQSVRIDASRIFGGIGVIAWTDAELTLRNSVIIDASVGVDASVGCTIENNVFHGGGIVAGSDGGISVIRNNRIENAPEAGIRITDTGEAILEDNVLLDCVVGIDFHADHGRIERNVVLRSGSDGIRWRSADGGIIAHNVVGRSGGHGISLPAVNHSDSVYIRNNTSFANDSSGFHTRDVLGSHFEVSLRRNIAYGNARFGLHAEGPRAPESSCNDWYGNDAGSIWGTSASPADLSVDPRFCDVAHDDVRLAVDSPLLDAPGCGLVGALGVGCGTPVDVRDSRLPTPLGDLALSPATPNPTWDRAFFAFRLARAGDVSLEALDVSGRLVATLAHGRHEAGTHRAVWDVRRGNVAAGLYLVRLRQGGEQVVRRVVVTR